MTDTQNRVRLFLRIFEEMQQVMSSDSPWEVKHELVFSLAAEASVYFQVRYYTPDTTYQDDARVCFGAYETRARELALAFGINLKEST